MIALMYGISGGGGVLYTIPHHDSIVLSMAVVGLCCLIAGAFLAWQRGPVSQDIGE